ncbi:MAG: DUF3999 family protein [Acidobacteria bacterium]|nr:DUF3999 family protein [Acidobacteriota bacterium]
MSRSRSWRPGDGPLRFAQGFGSTLLLPLVALLELHSAIAPASGSTPQTIEREVRPGAKGPNRLDLDTSLMATAMPLRYSEGRTQDWGRSPQLRFLGGLEDLRLVDASGREVGYLLVSPPERVPQWRTGRLLPVRAGRFASGFDVDLGTAGMTDRLRISGLPSPFLKRFRLEASVDGNHWSVAVAEGTLFDLPEENLRLIEIGFPRGELRYFRLTWDDRSSARLPIPREVSAREAPGQPAPSGSTITLGFRPRASEPGKSRFAIGVPSGRLPITALKLEVSTEPLLRPATIAEARLQGEQIVSVPLGSTTLRIARHGDLLASDLRIPIARPEEPELELVVEDGDNAPLDLIAVRAELAPLPWIYFESEAGAALVARYGGAGYSAPRYDIEAKRELVAGAVVAEAQWSPARELRPRQPETEPAGSALSVGGSIDSSKFRYRRKIPQVPPGLTVLPLDAAALAHSTDLRDIRIADEQGRQVPYLLEKRDEPLSLDLPPLESIPYDPEAKAAPEAARVSRYRIRLPYDTLPASRLVLSTASRVFARRVWVVVDREATDRRSKPWRETVAEVAWVHADAGRPARDVVLALPALGTATCELDVDEGDNSPLPIASPRLLLPSRRLRFFSTAVSALSLLYGQPRLPAPRYDIALLAPTLLGQAAQEASLGAESPGPAAQEPPVPHMRLFWGALIAGFVVLMLLLVRLLLKK